MGCFGVGQEDDPATLRIHTGPRVLMHDNLHKSDW